MDDYYDIIILGTGLKQSILAGLFSMQKKKVLLVDKNSFFGGDTASLNLTQLWSKFRPGVKVPEKYGHNRDWSIDLIPKMVLADGALVKLMLKSTVKKYLEWKPNQVTYVMQYQEAGLFTKAKPMIYKVPATDSEALRSSLMGIFEKKRCRQFYIFCEKVKEKDKTTWKGIDLEKETMRQVFKRYNLQDNTVDFIGHSVALWNDDKYLDQPAMMTLKKINVYMNSLGLYGDSPFLYPIYGLGGISEAFIRLCSLYGGTVKIDCKIGPIIAENNEVKGVEVDGKMIKSPIIIADSHYTKAMTKTVGKVIRAICILDHTIPKTKKANSVQIILPQKQLNRNSDVYITMISSEHCVCKQGFYIAIVSATIETDTPEKEIEPALNLLGPVLEKFISINEINKVDEGTDQIKNLFLTNSYDATSHFESESQNIFDVYERITGNKFDLNAEIQKEDTEVKEKVEKPSVAKTTKLVSDMSLGDQTEDVFEKDLRDNTWVPDHALVADSESEKDDNTTFDPLPSHLKTDFFTDQAVPNLLDYDVIGFDVEHCLVSFLTVNYFKHQIQYFLRSLQELDPKYGSDQLSFDFDTYLPICMNCVLWDIQRGNVLKLAQGKQIMHAAHGFTKLTQSQIIQQYGDPPVFNALKWPERNRQLENEEGAYWVFIGQSEYAKIGLICQIVHQMKLGEIKGKTFMQFAFDLSEVSNKWNDCYSYAKKFPETKLEQKEPSNQHDLEYIWPMIYRDPSKYIRPRNDLKETLQNLQKAGKKIFLTTNGHKAWTDLILSKSLGKEWQKLFDFCLLGCQKPLFYTAENSFFRQSDGLKIRDIQHLVGLSKDENVFYGGNARGLVSFFEQSVKRNSLRFVNFSSQYLQDIHSVPYLSQHGIHWDSIAIISELSLYTGSQDDSLLIHDDQFWGVSYFFDQIYDWNQDKTKKVAVGEVPNYFVHMLSQCARYAVCDAGEAQKMMIERGMGISTENLAPRRQSSFTVTEHPDGTIQMEPKGTHLFTLIWLHGLNEKTSYYQETFEDVRLPDGVRILMPKAQNGAWYDVDIGEEWSEVSNAELLGVMQSVKRISDIVLKEVEELGSAKKVYLGGFCQGGSVVLQTYLRFNRGVLGGVVCIGGCYLGRVDWTVTETKAKTETPLFLYHGQEDEDLPMKIAQKSYDHLVEKGIDHFSFASEPGLDHELSEHATRLLSDFFRQHMIAPELARFKSIMLASKKSKRKQFYRRRGDLPDTVELHGGLYVQVLQGDIVTDEVDAIVCPTNGKLSHGDGVSGQMQEKGGREFQLKSNEYVKQHGVIPVSHCGWTEGTGELKAKTVIHAVQPTISSSSDPLYDLMHEQLELLDKTIQNVLLTANDKVRCRSVSIPSIPNSHQETKFPIPVMARTFFDAIAEHASLRTEHKKDGLQLIRLINPDQETTQIFRDELNQRYPEDDAEDDSLFTDDESVKSEEEAEVDLEDLSLKESHDPTQTLQPLLYRGSDFPRPDLNKHFPRLFNHNLDPFSARTRYMLSFCRIDFQSIAVKTDDKADWHMNLNDGRVPIFETPELCFTSSTQIIAHALENSGARGLDLLPQNTDSYQNSSMFRMMEKFNVLIKPFLQLYSSRGQDNSLLERFVTEDLCQHEALAANSIVEGEQKYLQGTDEITLVDIHIAPFWELMFLFQHGYMKTVWDKLDMKTNAPSVLGYIKKFRKNDLVKNHRMSQQIFINRCIREQWEITENKAKLKEMECSLCFEYQGIVDMTTELTVTKKMKNFFETTKPMISKENEEFKKETFDLMKRANAQRQEIEQIIQEDPVVIFTTSLAEKKTKSPAMNYLDRSKRGSAMHDELVKMSEHGGQPNLFIFIGGEHLGGKVELKRAAESGALKQLLDKVGISHNF